MKKLLSKAAIVAIAGLSYTAPSFATQLTLGHQVQDENFWGVAANTFAELVEERTGGDITVAVFPRAQLGGEVQQIQGARSGAIDITFVGTAVLENTVPEMGVLALPYLFDSYQQANEVLLSERGAPLLSHIDDHDLKGLSFLPVFERNVYGNRAIQTLDDMEGLKARIIPGPGFVRSYELLGAQPTPTAYSEVYLALQSGVVEAGEASPDQVIQDGFAEVSQYYNMTKVHVLAGAMVMSGRAYDRLSPEQQEIVGEAAGEAALAAAAVYEDDYNRSLEELQARGIDIIEPDLAEFQAAGRAVWEQLLANVPNGEENVGILTE